MRCYLIILATLFINRSFAQQPEPIQTDRPDQTESPVTMPKRYFQMETGFSYEKTDKQSSSILLPTCLFRYGISERTELRLIAEVEQQKYLSKKNTGLNPVTIGLKTNLAKEKGILPNISFIGYLTLPHVASCSNKNIYYAPAFLFTMENNPTEKFSLGYNLGAEWDGISAEPTFIYTLSAGLELSEKIATFLEVYGFAPQQSKADHRLDTGFTFLLSNNASFDISGGIGLTSNAPSYFLGTGFSFRFK